METLQITWFILLGVLLSVFIISCSCDYGAGISALFSKESSSRNFALKSILPFWDGNGVWLITAGGALFAAFPQAYSIILSTIYTPVILLLFFTTLRIAAIEFGASAKSYKTQNLWTRTFAISSLISFLLIGIVLGAIFDGKILPTYSNFLENFFRIFTPLSILSGLLLVAFALNQGGLFIRISARDFSEFPRLRPNKTSGILMFIYMLYSVAFTFSIDTHNERITAILLLVACYFPLRISNYYARRIRYTASLISASVFALMLVMSHLLLAYPNIIPSQNPDCAISIYEASSSVKTLKLMLLVALIGVPLAIAYNAYSLYVFFKKAQSHHLKN